MNASSFTDTIFRSGTVDGWPDKRKILSFRDLEKRLQRESWERAWGVSPDQVAEGTAARLLMMI